MNELLASLTEHRAEMIRSIVETGSMLGNSLLAAVRLGRSHRRGPCTRTTPRGSR